MGGKSEDPSILKCLQNSRFPNSLNTYSGILSLKQNVEGGGEKTKREANVLQAAIIQRGSRVEIISRIPELLQAP